ncbi:MAG TPA: vWA domain-containing protein, partial [Pirellulales bacterium]
FALQLTPQVAAPKTQRLDLVVVFDTSASQAGIHRAKALGALRALLSSLDAGDRVGLAAADVNAMPLTRSLAPAASPEIKQALTALEKRVPLGSTDMRQALETALPLVLSSNQAGRAKVVLYIGDGFSTANPVLNPALERISKQFKQARVSFSSYAIGPRVAANLLGALSKQTGGVFVPDDERGDAQFGGYLAAVCRSVVVWPTKAKLPRALSEVYPREMPPLRFDRDSVLVGAIDSAALGKAQPLAIEVGAVMAGKPVTLRWQVTPEAASADNAYLAKMVEAARQTGGVDLAIIDSNGLNAVRRLTNYGAQQLARLSQRAMAVGQADEAAQLAGAAEDLSPVNAEANLVRTAATRLRQKTQVDLRLARRAPPEKLAPGPDADRPAEAGDGDLLDDVERQNHMLQEFLQKAVATELTQANVKVANDPEGTLDELKLLMDKVQKSAELDPQVRAQLVAKIEAALRSAHRLASVQAEKTLERQQIIAEGEARERINRELFLQEQKVDQLMSRFNALMDEERFRDAEVLADISEELMPNQPGLRGAELTARMVGWTTDMAQIRDMRHRGFVDATMQIELSHIPTADEPPVLYPDPEVWQLLTERRKKYKAVDLTSHGPNETKIMAALDDKTELDFAEQPLSDVVDYLKQRHDIEIQLDNKALTDAGVGSDTPITRSIKNITLRSALKLILSELDLTYIVRNEVLMITSKTEAESMLSTRVYPVADLVVPIANPMQVMGGRGGRGMFNVRDDEAADEVADEVTGEPRAGSRGFRAFFVGDDLTLTKKSKAAKRQPQPAAAAENPAAAKPKAAEPLELKGKKAQANPPVDGKLNDNPVVNPAELLKRRAAKVKPIQIDFKKGDNIDELWNDYFAAHTGEEAPTDATVRETVARLMNDHEFGHAIACMYGALRNQQGQPWMYESLSIALQSDRRPPDEIERVLLSVLDFASNPVEVMYLAQYMARSGLEKRALQLFQQVSQVLPFAPQPYVAGLQLAQKLDDLEGIEWATLGILSQPWPQQQMQIWDSGKNAASALLERLRSENRKDEAKEYKRKIDEALIRDLVVVLSWNGEADVDLLVEEPAGSVCSFRIPRTLSGGIMLGDTVARSKKEELKAEGAQEAYVLPKGFNGDYRVLVRRVWGKVAANKVTVDVIWHYWTKQERIEHKQIDLSGDEALCVVPLEGGRRTEPLEQQQLANAVANQVALQWFWHALYQQQLSINGGNQADVNRQINAQTDYSAVGSMAKARGKQIGGPGRLDRVNPFFVRGVAGYQPSISSFPQGAMMFTSAVVSADRRYVRVSPIPFFSEITQVNTFNYFTGANGTSPGGGQGGFGGGGGF